MPVEVHLPDLPEVPISIGAPPAAALRPRLRWHLRLRDGLVSYLPLLLMGLLALGSWWLVKNVPPPLKPRVDAPLRSDPDYTMSRFVLERFEPTGRLKVRIEGEQMRHYPDTDRIEIDQLELRAFAPDGRVTLARARRALSNGDGSELQLMGQARVDSVDANGVPLVVASEFLHVFTVTERLRTHLPVTVQRAGAEMRAAGMDYAHATGLLQMQGPQRAVFPARVPGGR
jgi:lipopolysaccharide export system protein LptC